MPSAFMFAAKIISVPAKAGSIGGVLSRFGHCGGRLQMQNRRRLRPQREGADLPAARELFKRVFDPEFGRRMQKGREYLSLSMLANKQGWHPGDCGNPYRIFGWLGQVLATLIIAPSVRSICPLVDARDH
jgi:hypothetical protein